MRSAVTIGLLMAILLLGGCAPADESIATDPQDSSPSVTLSPADVQMQIETAAQFALAEHFGDSQLLASLIDASDAAGATDEIASIKGKPV